MATIKSHTDLEQSRKLAKILPTESADMCYEIGEDLDGYITKTTYTPLMHTPYNDDYIPCWSLAALLDIIPKHIKDHNVLRIDINENDTAIWYDEIGCGVNNELPDVTKETAIDACVEVILKLKENKLI